MSEIDVPQDVVETVPVGFCPFCGQPVTEYEFSKAVYACENVADDSQAEDIANAFGLLGHPVQIGDWAAVGPFCSRCVGKAIRGTLAH